MSKQQAKARQRSLAWRVNFRLSVAFAGLLLVIGSFNYANSIFPQEKSLKNNAQHMADKISLLLSEKIWQLDSSGIGEILSRTPAPRELRSLSITNEFGDSLYSRNDRLDVPLTNASTKVYRKGQLIGQVKVSFDASSLSELRKATITNHLLILFCGLLVFILANWLLLRRIIGTPLRSLGKELQDISTGQRRQLLEPCGLRELDQINEAVNKMALQIEERTKLLEREIAERKQAQEQLRLSEQRYRLLTENSDDYICEIDQMGRYCYANPTHLRLGGYSQEDLMGNDPSHYLHPDSLEPVMNELKKVAETHSAALLSYQVRLNSGEYIWAESHVCPFQTASGDWHAVVVSRDITQRKKYEEELERGVAGRTAALASANDQLRQEISEREAAESRLKLLRAQLYLTEERTRRRIALGLHDEVAQNLALLKMKIQQFSKFSGHESHSNVFGEMIALISTTIADVKSLVFEIYPDSLFEMGLEAALSALARRFSEKHPQTAIEFSSDGPQISLHKDVQGLLYHAVRELLTNTIKHASASSVRISMERSTQSCRICVADDGLGFSPALNGNAGGSSKGFGLFSIKEQVESMGGQFNVESRPGEGTICSISISVLPHEQNPNPAKNPSSY